MQNVCTSCKNGYKFDINNNCVPAIPGCLEYRGISCVSCEVGLLVFNGICIPKYCRKYT